MNETTRPLLVGRSETGMVSDDVSSLSELELHIKTIEKQLSEAENKMLLKQSHARIFAGEAKDSENEVARLREELRRLRGRGGSIDESSRPSWLGPDTFKGSRASQSILDYLRLRERHAGDTSPVSVERELVTMLRLGGLRKFDQESPTDSKAIRTAITTGLVEKNMVKYNRENDTVQLPHWPDPPEEENTTKVTT